MRSTTRSSLAWTEPRAAITWWRPVRISRADAAAEAGMAERYQMRFADATRDTARWAIGLGATKAFRETSDGGQNAVQSIQELQLSGCPGCRRTGRRGDRHCRQAASDRSQEEAQAKIAERARQRTAADRGRGHVGRKSSPDRP